VAEAKAFSLKEQTMAETWLEHRWTVPRKQEQAGDLGRRDCRRRDSMQAGDKPASQVKERSQYSVCRIPGRQVVGIVRQKLSFQETQNRCRFVEHETGIKPVVSTSPTIQPTAKGWANISSHFI